MSFAAAAAYISLFQRFGDALIFADSVLTSYEVEAFADYLNALRSYQERAAEAES